VRLLASIGRLVAGAALAALVWSSCAKVGAPPGGPEDKTGPSLIEFYPENNAVLVPRRMTARLVFSEPVNRSSVEAALFLSPDPRQRVRYRWRGRELDLIFLDSLEAERTYVISVGSQAKDLRGNPAGNTSTIAFSTGEHIDRGRIDGWLTGVKSAQAVSLWAYALGTDSLVNPAWWNADYRLQADQDGNFRFEHIRAGRYRVFAVEDRNQDGYWNPPAERLGIPPWDVSVTDTTMPWVSFRPAEFDTVPARIHNVRAVDQRQIDVRMNRPVASLRAGLLGESGDSVGIVDAYPDTSGGDVWHVFAVDTLSPGRWWLTASGADIFGSRWHDRDSVEVRARLDTTRPHILETVPRNRTTVTRVPDTLALIFDEPVTISADIAASFRLISGGADTMLLAGIHRAPRIVTFAPAPPLQAAKSYTLLLAASAIHDASGNAAGDSLLSFSFNILSPDSLGTLVGRISGDLQAPYLVTALTLRDREIAGRTTVSGASEFDIRLLAAGLYLVEVIGDRDHNGEFTYGSIKPLQMSEPFLFLPDTVTIRARWESEVRIEWPPNP
jgi:uncharacterized protein (DUF2141 family)